MAQDGSKMAQDGSKMGQDGLKGFNMTLSDPPKWLSRRGAVHFFQNLPISAPSKIFLSSRAFSIPQNHPRRSQDTSKRSPRWPKIAKDGFKIAGPTPAQRGPISPRDFGNVRDLQKLFHGFKLT